MSDKAPNPYVGPVPFERNDDRPFYGRDGDLRRLAILFIAQRIVLLYSPSGAGKTSLVQARLIPALEDEEFEVLPVIRVGRELGQQPTGEPGPTNIFLRNTINYLECDRESGEAYSSFDDYWQARRAELGDKPAVLFFDQFEEVLTVDPHDRQQKEAFFDQVGEVLEKDDRLWALFAIREDYLAELDPYRHLIPGKLNNSYRLELLNPDQAMDAIQRPAEDVGVAFSEKAAQKLVGQLRRVQVRRLDGEIADEMGNSVEPVQLQVVCQNLWNKLEPAIGDTIRSEAISAEGHVDRSLGEFYDETVTCIAAKTDSEEHFRDWFEQEVVAAKNLRGQAMGTGDIHLEPGVIVAGDGADQRDIRDWFKRELITPQGLRGQVMGSGDLHLGPTVIAALIDAHLVRADERRGIQWYELAHDRLIKPVRQRNEAWFKSNLKPWQIRAETWKRTKDDDLLLRGKDLNDVSITTYLREYEAEFIRLSLNRQQAERQARVQGCKANLLKIFAVVVIAILLVLLVEEIYKNAVGVWDLADPAAEPIVLHGHEGSVRSVAFSPTGDRLASAGDDSTIRLWDLTDPTAEPIVLRGHEGPVQSVAFSPAGDRLASAGADWTIRLWDLTNPAAEPLPLTGHEDWVRSVAFSPSGNRLASAGDDLTIRLWDLTNPAAEPLLLTGHEDWVKSVAFSPAGNHLASAGDDETVRLWDLADPAAEPMLLRGDRWVNSVAFSPAGDHLAIAGDDSTIHLWDLADPTAEPVGIRGHEDWVRSVAFSPAGDRLASAGDDETVRVVWRSTPLTLAEFCVQVGRNFTWDEWQELLSGRDYEKTCSQYPVHCSVPAEEWPAEFAYERDQCSADPQ